MSHYKRLTTATARAIHAIMAKDESSRANVTNIIAELVAAAEENAVNKKLAFDDKEAYSRDGWITVNGTHVETGENGELKGAVGEKITKAKAEKAKVGEAPKAKAKTKRTPAKTASLKSDGSGESGGKLESGGEKPDDKKPDAKNKSENAKSGANKKQSSSKPAAHVGNMAGGKRNKAQTLMLIGQALSMLSKSNGKETGGVVGTPGVEINGEEPGGEEADETGKAYKSAVKGTRDADDDDMTWITVNGAHIPMVGGKPANELGKKILGGENNGSSEGVGNTGLAEGTGVGKPADQGAGGVANAMVNNPGNVVGTNSVGSSSNSAGSSVGKQDGGVRGYEVRDSRIINPISEVAPSSHEDALKNLMERDPAHFATVDLHSADELKDSKCFVGEAVGTTGNKAGKQGKFGSVVRSDGDITGVFNDDGSDGSRLAMLKALENGGNKLDAYAVDNKTGDPGQLAYVYHKTGFTPIARVPFNPEFAAPGVKPQDIVFYAHNGDSAQTVAANYGKYAPPTKAQYDALPVMDYDEAAKYRDSKISKK